MSINATLAPLDELGLAIDGTFLMFAGALVFLMQAGFQLLEAGSVAKAAPVQIVLKNILDVCVGGVFYFLVGYAWAFGEEPGSNGFVGHGGYALVGVDPTTYIFWFFQFCFSAATATIVSGAVAERINFKGYLIFSVLVVAWVQPVVAHWIWSNNGWLSAYAPASDTLLGLGVLDFAGSGVIHAVGGVASLVGVFIMGFRNQFIDAETRRARGNPPELVPRFQQNELGEWKMNQMKQHSPVLASTGVFLLAVGWLGFNGGSALMIVGRTDVVGRVLINTVLSASVCSLGCLFYGRVQRRNQLFYKWDLNDATNGMLCGLVIVTGGAAYIELWASLVYGAFGVIAYKLTDAWVTSPRLRLDDPVGAIAVHGAGGVAGLILNGFFAYTPYVAQISPTVPIGGAFYAGGTGLRVAVQLIGALLIIVWTALWSFLLWGFFWLLDRNRGSGAFFLLRGLERERLAVGYIDEDEEFETAEDSAVAVGFIDPLAIMGGDFDTQDVEMQAREAHGSGGDVSQEGSGEAEDDAATGEAAADGNAASEQHSTE